MQPPDVSKVKLSKVPLVERTDMPCIEMSVTRLVRERMRIDTPPPLKMLSFTMPLRLTFGGQ